MSTLDVIVVILSVLLLGGSYTALWLDLNKKLKAYEERQKEENENKES